MTCNRLRKYLHAVKDQTAAGRRGALVVQDRVSARRYLRW